MEATTGTDIKATRERAQFLDARVAALELERDGAAANEAAARSKLEAAKNGLTDGTTNTVDVMRAQTALDDASDVGMHVQEALDKVSLELQERKGEISAYAAEDDRARQEAAAEPLRRLAQEQLRAFASTFAGLRGMLTAFGDTCRELEAKYPNATPIERVTLDELAKAVREDLRRQGLMTAAASESHIEFRTLIERTLIGPYRGGAEYDNFKTHARIA
jgi:hypothetical protein